MNLSIHKYSVLVYKRTIAYALAVFFSVTIASVPSSSNANTPSGESPADSVTLENSGDTLSDPTEESFTYELENRKDPFIPFLTPKATTSSVDMDEIVDSTGELSGMQLFEPGQLTLVALLTKEDGRIAMVEDVTGKGYIISAGTKIGRRGVVKDIIPNKVLIEETAFTRAGKKIVTKIVMVLKKEGEE